VAILVEDILFLYYADVAPIFAVDMQTSGLPCDCRRVSVVVFDFSEPCNGVIVYFPIALVLMTRKSSHTIACRLVLSVITTAVMRVAVGMSYLTRDVSVIAGR
jgi:hypothetical protein